MNYSKNIFNKAYEKAKERQDKANSEANLRREKICREIPEILETERELTSISVKTARAVLKGADAKSELEKLKEESLKLQNRIAYLLNTHGYREDYMEPQYYCPICRDSTFVEKDGKSLYCQCFLNLLRDCACEEINKLSPLKLSTFETFSLDYYSYDSDQGGVSPYANLSKIFNYCQNYAHNFDENSRSLLMRGATGLGKTHLSLAIANELLNKGYYVVYVSAPSILSELEKAHFDREREEESSLRDTLCDCDLLILDDLGTEYSNPFTKAEVYNIFNERLLRNKPTIINTNMTLRELELAYSQRFVSRILGSCSRLEFIGKDVRTVKLRT